MSPLSERGLLPALLSGWDEVRRRAFRILAVLLPLSGVAFVFRERLMIWAILPSGLTPAGGQLEAMLAAWRGWLFDHGFSPEQTATALAALKRAFQLQSGLVFLSPLEGFTSQLLLSLCAAALVAAPWVMFQVWAGARNLLPHLRQERPWGTPALALLLFYLGIAFGYAGVLPWVMGYLIAMGDTYVQAQFSIASYLSFSLWFTLTFGLAFELPLVVYWAVKLGLVSHKTLSLKRRYVILIAFVVGALLTPPDVFSQIALAVPLIVLYEASLLVAAAVERRRPAPLQAGP